MTTHLDPGPGVGTGQSTTLITLGRLSLPATQDDFKESFGAPLDTTGAGAALGQRRPKAFTFTIPILAFQGTGGVDLAAVALRMRRQLRSMLQNAQLRGQGIYFASAVDPELNGWVMIGQGQIAYDEGNIVAGHFTVTVDEIYKVATRGTHRPGIRFVVADRRLASTPRDYLEQIYSTDFAGLSSLSLNALPPGASSLARASGLFPGVATWAGADGTGFLMVNMPTEEAVSFEQPENSRNLGQVVAYDRRGNITAPTTGQDPLWEEVYGEDWPWNWQVSGQPADCPVLMNGRCRVRLDNTVSTTIGLTLDAWTGSAWAEQGKIVFRRWNVDASTFRLLDGFESAALVAYNSERAVVELVLVSSVDTSARDTVYVSLQRGWAAPRIEMYPSVAVSGARCGGGFYLEVAAADANDSAMKIDASGIASINASAGSGSALVPSAFVGSLAFPGENEVMLLRQGQPFGVAAAVVQAATGVISGNDSQAYGTARSFISLYTTGGGYFSAHLGFPAQQSDQVMEAEAIRNASGTTSTISSGGTSGGQIVQETQAAETHATLLKAVNLLAGAVYRCFARVTVASSTTGSFRVTGGASPGPVVTTTSTAWVWLDLGEQTMQPTPAVQINAWHSAGSGPVYIDRVEMFLVEDRASALSLFAGGRDLGQSALADARNIPVPIER